MRLYAKSYLRTKFQPNAPKNESITKEFQCSLFNKFHHNICFQSTIFHTIQFTSVPGFIEFSSTTSTIRIIFPRLMPCLMQQLKSTTKLLATINYILFVLSMEWQLNDSNGWSHMLKYGSLLLRMLWMY